MIKNFSGIVGAPVTPFDQKNRVDYVTFAKQINFLIKNGVSLIAHPMHIGESINLTIEERKDLAQCLVESAGGRVPTFVHCSFGGTDQAADLASYCEKVGTTGIVLLAPYYWRSKTDAIIDHIVTVAGRLKGKLIVYNNPKATQVEISPDIFSRLLDRLPNFIGFKDASFDMKYFTEICRRNEEKGSRVAVYTGVEYLLTSMPVGGRGCFSACSEVAPKLVLSLYRACAAMDVKKARLLQYQTRQLLTLLYEDHPMTLKYVMGLMGRPVGQTRKPLPPLSPEKRARVKKGLKSLAFLEKEPRGW